MRRCFTACFADSKHGKAKRPINWTSPLKNQNHEGFENLQPSNTKEEAQTERKIVEEIALLKETSDEHLNGSTRKKVKLGPNVKANDGCPVQETAKHLGENKKAKEEDEKENTSKVEASNIPALIDAENDNSGEDQALIQEESTESLFSLNIDHLKQVPAAGMDEKEVTSPLKSTGLVLEAKDRNQRVHSLLKPIENIYQHRELKAVSTSSFKLEDKENIVLEQEPVPSLLHPIKVVKAMKLPSPSYLDEKENIMSEQESQFDFEDKENILLKQEPLIPLIEEPNLKQSSLRWNQIFNQKKQRNAEITVDTSLSSWLHESERTPNSENSSDSVGEARSFENRQTLGTSYVKELTAVISSSPRLSPSESSDGIPFIGTVGSYWRHTGHAMDSDSASSCQEISGTPRKSAGCEKVVENSDSTPFHSRLEKALEDGVARVCPA